jgi:hypothetical protein
MTPLRQDPSAQAPCTKTMFGRSLISFSALRVGTIGAEVQSAGRANVSIKSSHHKCQPCLL